MTTKGVLQNGRRVSRLFRAAGALGCAILAGFWLLRLVRGDSGQHPYQIVRGLTLTTAMATMFASDFVRTERARWYLLGLGTVLLITHGSLTFAGGRVLWPTVGALLVSGGGIVVAARALWPPPNLRLSEWRMTAATVEQLRGVCTGVAIFIVGAALTLISVVDLKRVDWIGRALVASFALLCLYGSVMFLVLRSRLSRKMQA